MFKFGMLHFLGFSAIAIFCFHMVRKWLITNSKYLVANCRKNAEDNLRNLPIPKIPSPWLRNGAHSKGSQPDSPFSLGRTEGSASVKYLEL